MISMPEDSSKGFDSNDDPTPNEISQAAAEIRGGWTESQKQRRRVQKCKSSWLPPRINLRDVPPDTWSEDNSAG
ncbi:MAG: hypothetical protein KDB03_00005 [Planctomycetales bacterium]|nr:hypothetical protein [Planctomycetales bacterium]